MSQNENTPQYIKQVPWYAQKEGKVGSGGQAKATPQFQQWYDRGSKGFQASTFRKGACQNCGAMGHNRKDCTERPRKVPAKFSAQNIAPDDLTKQLNFDWEGKRDRWNGYNSEMYKEVIDEYQELQQIRKRAREEQGEQAGDQQFKQSLNPLELANLPGKSVKNKKYQNLGGVRNREDYAKYLLNLDVNSDHFDPKSRSMKSYDNPASHLDNLEVIGQRDQLIGQDRFAAEQVELHNSELSSVALPTLTQKIYKKIKQNQQSISSVSKVKQIAKKYGQSTGDRPFDVIEENEEFIDYSQHKKKTTKSRYDQDVLINDHLSVWGSWYNKLLGWGYLCCHSTDKQSYCLGNKGKEKALAAELKVKAQRLRDLQQLEQTSKVLLTEDKQKEGQKQNET